MEIGKVLEKYPKVDRNVLLEKYFKKDMRLLDADFHFFRAKILLEIGHHTDSVIEISKYR